MNLSDLRSTLKSQRAALSQDERARLSATITDTLKAQAFYQTAQHIAFYLPVRGEVDTRSLIASALQAGKQCYLPILAHDIPNHLYFMPYTADTPLQPNTLGIEEPLYNEAALVQPQALELVITPLLAFDPACHRIGMGAGYYDRTFAFLKAAKRPERPVLCGLGYEFQRIADTEPKSWDIGLNWVISELNVYNNSYL